MDITAEFEGAELADARLNRRLVLLAQSLASDPAASFPVATKTEAGLEAAYRFLNNPRVEPELILAPHVAQTQQRCRAAGRVIVAHDTTTFTFPTNRQGLGRLSNGVEQRCFFQHMALAIAADGTRLPLGVVGERRHTRPKRSGPRASHHSERKPERRRESDRWWRLFAEAAERLEGCEAIHVCDREADMYLLMARAIERGMRFVIRANHDRHLEAPGKPTLRQVTRSVAPSICRRVSVAPRKPSLSWLGTAKRGRIARLEIAATSVTIRQPREIPSTRKKPLPTLSLNVVHVREVGTPPAGFESIDWLLLTTEPIDTAESIEAIVDAYDTRWVIEEYFRALKTGCAAERRQLESAEAIYNAVALFIPIACQLLRLRHYARETPDADADGALTGLELRILQNHPSVKLSPKPTVQKAWLAVARLGGHLKRPGWQVIFRGYLQLQVLAQGAQLIAGPGCDQS